MSREQWVLAPRLNVVGEARDRETAPQSLAIPLAFTVGHYPVVGAQFSTLPRSIMRVLKQSEVKSVSGGFFFLLHFLFHGYGRKGGYGGGKGGYGGGYGGGKGGY